MRAEAILVCAVFGLAFALPSARDRAEAELKVRFRQRRPVIQRLKDAGKLGETAVGTLSVVELSCLDESVRLRGKPHSIRDLVDEENRDRTRLYELIAQTTGATAGGVATQAALRNYREAAPDHYLLTRSGTWRTKRALQE